METKISYTSVGVFVLILTIALVVFIVWLSAGFSTGHYKNYLVLMHESVAGLGPNSLVKYNGVNVGVVKKISLDKNNPEEVRLFLQIEESVSITTGTTAMLNRQGLTGITYIELQGGDKHLKPIPTIPGEPYPIIQSKPSLFLRLENTLQDLNSNMNQITKNINDILGGDNPVLLRQILSNLTITTNHLATQSKQLDSILINTARTTRTLPSLMNTLTQQTLPAANEVLSRLTLMSNSLLELTDDVKQNPGLLIRGTKPAPGPGEK